MFDFWVTDSYQRSGGVRSGAGPWGCSGICGASELGHCRNFGHKLLLVELPATSTRCPAGSPQEFLLNPPKISGFPQWESPQNLISDIHTPALSQPWLKLLHPHFPWEEHAKIPQNFDQSPQKRILVPLGVPWFRLQLWDGFPGCCWSAGGAAARPPAVLGLSPWPLGQNNSMDSFHLPQKFSVFQEMQIQFKAFPRFLSPFHPRDCSDHLSNHKEEISERKKGISICHRNHRCNGWNNPTPSLSMDKSFVWHWCFGLPRKILQAKV